jgi:chromosome segregation ATPase
MTETHQSPAKLEEAAITALRVREEEAARETTATKRREKGQARIAAAENRLRGLEASLYEATVRVAEAKDRHRNAEAERRVALDRKQRLQQEAISLRNAIETMKAHIR